MNALNLLTSAALLIAAATPPASAQLVEIPRPRTPDVVYVPTPQPVVEAMLKLAKVQPGEIVYDLGCGDGRAVITAARDFGARGIGVDIDPQRIEESRENAASAGVTDRVQIKQEDLFKMDFSDADVLFLYLLSTLNERLRPRILKELKPGTRVVSNTFSMGEWEPDATEHVSGKTIYFWVVPADIAGEWNVTLPGGERGVLSVRQRFQKVDGALQVNGRALPLRNARLKGPTLTFAYGDGSETGRGTAEITGERLTGTLVRNGAQPQPWSGERSR